MGRWKSIRFAMQGAKDRILPRSLRENPIYSFEVKFQRRTAKAAYAFDHTESD